MTVPSNDLTHVLGDARLYHAGVAVADLDAAMEHYGHVWGLGPWSRIDTNYPARFGEWTGTVANRNAFAEWGPILLEMVEPGLGESPAKQWLREKGPGIFHLGYSVDEPVDHLGDLGVSFEVLDLQTAKGTRTIVYLDTIASLGYWVELVDRPLADRIISWVTGQSSSV